MQLADNLLRMEQRPLVDRVVHKAIVAAFVVEPVESSLLAVVDTSVSASVAPQE